jgi:metal-responsive CopG/Arc/MetJ family transcriptional regulator
LEEPKKLKLPIASFYINQQLIKQFDEIVKREGSNRSKRLNEFINDYVLKHQNGNPQLLMSTYVKNEHSPMKVQCRFCQGATNEGKIYCDKKGVWIKGLECYSCKFNKLRKREATQ